MNSENSSWHDNVLGETDQSTGRHRCLIRSEWKNHPTPPPYGTRGEKDYLCLRKSAKALQRGYRLSGTLHCLYKREKVRGRHSKQEALRSKALKPENRYLEVVLLLGCHIPWQEVRKCSNRQPLAYLNSWVKEKAFLLKQIQVAWRKADGVRSGSWVILG